MKDTRPARKRRETFEAKFFTVMGILIHSGRDMAMDEVLALSPYQESETRQVLNYAIHEGFITVSTSQKKSA